MNEVAEMWYNLIIKGDTAHIDIYGDIGSYGLNAEIFIEEIRQAEGKKLVLNISSLGGSVNDALQIHDYIASYPNKVTAKITGLTASSATIVAMAASEVLMSENALFLIHNVWTPITSGNAEDLEKEAEGLRQIDDILISIYKKKTGKRKSLIKTLMAEEQWLDAETALTLGFIDKMYVPSKNIINKIILNKIDQDNLPTLPEVVLGDFINKQNLEKMTLEKINEKIDLIIAKVEGLFNTDEKAVETLNKSEVEATLNAEIEGLKELYDWQINEQGDTIKAKDEELNTLRLNFEESLKELNEKVEKLEANETKAVKEEDVPAVEEKAPEANPFDGIAEKMRW